MKRDLCNNTTETSLGEGARKCKQIKVVFLLVWEALFSAFVASLKKIVYISRSPKPSPDKCFSGKTAMTSLLWLALSSFQGAELVATVNEY